MSMHAGVRGSIEVNRTTLTKTTTTKIKNLPSMRSQLMTASKGLLDGRSLVVDASVQSASHEEGGLGTGGIKDVD